MIKSILVPLDGSPLAEQGLAVAEQIARAGRAKLYLALVHQPSAVPSGPVARAQLALHRAEREYLGRVRDRLRAGGAAGATAVVLKGNPREELTRYADERDPDLVVLASHGRGGFGRAWFGSVAEHLVRHLAAPVIVVHAREPAVTGPLERIMVALDGSAPAEKVIEHAAELARVLGAELLICRVVEPVPVPSDPILPVPVAADPDLTDSLKRDADAYLDDLVRRVSRTRVQATGKVFVALGVARTLLDAARGERVQLIALTTRGRSGLGRLGSVADKVMRAAPCPVLLVRPPRR